MIRINSQQLINQLWIQPYTFDMILLFKLLLTFFMKLIVMNSTQAHEWCFQPVIILISSNSTCNGVPVMQIRPFSSANRTCLCSQTSYNISLSCFIYVKYTFLYLLSCLLSIYKFISFSNACSIINAIKSFAISISQLAVENFSKSLLNANCSF